MKGAPGGVEGMQKMMREVMQGKGDPSAAATERLAKAMPSVDDLPSQYALVDDFLDAIVQHEASASSWRCGAAQIALPPPDEPSIRLPEKAPDRA